VNEQALDIASLEREFLGYAIAQAHPKVREWRGEGFEPDMQEATAAALRMITDDADAQRIAEVMHALALPAPCYKGRLLTVGDLRLIAHIDFPDASGDFPFVEVRCANLPLGSIADWPSLSAGLACAFREFRPRALYFFHPAHLPLRAPTTRADMHFLAAPARSMAKRPDASGLDRIELRRSTSLDFYQRYEAAYDQMLGERPHLRGDVKVESRETLAACLEEGLLSEVFVDGAWCGLIAARRDMIAGVRGIHVVEIVLTKGARGQGLGVAVHQRFARCVYETDPAAIMIGTISPNNAPSLLTASRAGRLEIGAYHWVDLQSPADGFGGLRSQWFFS